MATATISVKYVNAPKQEGWSGSIKDASGAYWNIPADKVAYWETKKGQSVGVTYETKGKYNTITGLAPAAAQQPAPTASPQANGHSTEMAEGIFITGVVGRAMGSGQFSIEDILTLTLTARSAWRALSQPIQAPAPRQPAPSRSDEPPPPNSEADYGQSNPY